jgi:hypothetical protein
MTLEFFNSSDCNYIWLKVKSFTFLTGIPSGILEEFFSYLLYPSEILKEFWKILLTNINSSCRQADEFRIPFRIPFRILDEF